jgi:hypothetical protein
LVAIFGLFASEGEHPCALQSEVEVPMASLSSAGLAALHSAFAAKCRIGATWLASLEFSDIHGRFKDANSGIDDLLALNI